MLTLRITVFLLLGCVPALLQAQPVGTTFLEDISPSEGLYQRLLGSVGSGSAGVPVAGGYDVDKDGKNDYAMAAMQASPLGRTRAGQVFLVFGNNTAVGVIDTAQSNPNVLEIYGDQIQESAGSEVWMGDLTGNGYGDLIVCRQNYSASGNRIGAGAATIILSDPRLRTMAEEGSVLDLSNPPEDLKVITINGANAYSRLCIWARNGDMTGDGIEDLAIGADQEVNGTHRHGGAIYLLRGGSWLVDSDDIDLADFGSVAVGNLARVRPSKLAGFTTTAEYHFGATLQVADLDGNNVSELIGAAALNRSGAALPPFGGASGETHSGGGTPRGTVFIAWDDNFGGTWDPAPDFEVDAGPGTHTVINGGSNPAENPGPRNDDFGEEILGGLDYDNDDKIDLFVGDLTADGYGSTLRGNAGTGHVIYDIASLKGVSVEIDAPPAGFNMATFLGPVTGAIAGDTALHGDFNGDGIDDVAFSSPMDSPFGVRNAGTLHILLGKTGQWPAYSDLTPTQFPTPADVQIHEIYGGSGIGGGGGGDVLCYSAASGDMTGDGRIDLIINEMQGDGSSPTAFDVGNMIIIDSFILFTGQEVFNDSFEQSAE